MKVNSGRRGTDLCFDQSTYLIATYNVYNYLSEFVDMYSVWSSLFLWNGNDKVTQLSTYAPYDQGGLKMLDFGNMVKALRLSWLKWIVDQDYFGFKSYLDCRLVKGGYF